MKVVIPLAGLGTRLRPQTYTRPKPLVELAGKPLLGHILDRLAPLPIEELIFITGYLGDQIEAYVATNYDLNASYVEQAEQLGQAHAIQLARDHLSGPTFIVFADTIFETDIDKLKSVQSDGVLYVHEVDDPRRFGVAVTEGQYITRLVEKPETPVSNLALVGLYYFTDGQQLISAIDALIESGHQTKGEYFIADAIQIMIDRGAKLETQTIDVWLDCGTPEALLDTNRYLLGTYEQQPCSFPGTSVLPPVYVADGANVENSVIGPYVSLGRGANVSGSIVRDSILGEGCSVENEALTGSIIGNRARVRGVYNTLNVGDTSYINLGAPED
ncbi:MAG: sugar phosphate nucleotidyltransferase [Chloroflexota bacterium]|nr:sugar phosphate nucleotidyltransferase [Chloroflexota bacterium]